MFQECVGGFLDACDLLSDLFEHTKSESVF